MSAVKLYAYFSGVFPTWSFQAASTPDETEVILMPPGAVLCLERDGVRCGDKFYSARNIHMLASCSLRGFSLQAIHSGACLEMGI